MKRIIAAVGASLCAAALTATASSPATAANDDAFYQPPADLPTGNGELIRSEPQELSVTILLQKIKGEGTRIMYKSTDAAGAPVAVTGTYIEPDAAWDGDGPRPLVAFAPGTQGQGDACAQSKTLSSAIDVQPGKLAAGYDVPSIASLVDEGYGVVVTDYVGLGTPDRLHTYTNRVDLGHSVLDAVRAAQDLEDTSLSEDSPVGLYGYSQGGGATGAAAELAPEYAPELDIKGAYVGAPPANLLEVTRSADGTSLTGVIGYAINGLLEYSPELRDILDAETNEAGKAALEKVKEHCTVDSILQLGFKNTTEWTESGATAAEIVENNPEALAVVEEQRLGTVKPAFPVMVLTGTQDDVVDHGQAKQVARDWCGKGGTVNYSPSIQALPSGGTGLNHITPIFVDAHKARGWLQDRFDGKRASSNCALVPVLP